MSGHMKVADIQPLLERNERHITARLHDITVDEGGRELRLVSEDGTDESFPLDEVAERHLGQYLDVSPVYLKKCPSTLKATNLNYWLHQQDREQGEATLVVGPDGIENIYSPDKTVVAIPRIAEFIHRTFNGEDEIVNLISEPGTFHADIMVNSSRIEVPGNGLGDRPDETGRITQFGAGIDPLDTPEEREQKLAQARATQVFDITHGGVRIIADPGKSKAPVVERYFNRLICTNGMTMPVPDHSITVRGKTVDEVIQSMEEAAEFLLGSMDDALEEYKALSEVIVPGNPLLFIQQLGREQGLPDRIIQQAMDYAGGAGFGRTDRDVTSFDVMQIFTGLANRSGVRYSTQRRLQNTAGLFVHRGDDLLHRCTQCERPLL
ncbi:hypothetical protein SEA_REDWATTLEHOG_88 [Gordonia phage RedWattleHog]|uniref:Uncharacterized protein n=1 Tax=Gordonia phage Stormageddon TaxID=2656541 RepID=A0A649VRL1_9CAUD|nr:hypothetical protein KHQ86_gp085 [Gordonia phage Stormageddon]QGJ94948.1 hypothetical protein SEA_STORMAGEDDON_85 [Gordonia phage Stormageddon]QLF83592.1 hypothetical protein SEA_REDWATTLEHOG_88 [Gordonia phage RedWattleHog]